MKLSQRIRARLNQPVTSRELLIILLLGLVPVLVLAWSFHQLNARVKDFHDKVQQFHEAAHKLDR